jgi:hypothetical protein
MSRGHSRAAGRTRPRTRREYSNAVNTAILYLVAWQNPAGGYRNAADTAIMPG